MPKKFALIGIPVLGLLLAGLVLLWNRSEEPAGTIERSRQKIDRVGTVSTETSRPVIRARWKFDRTLVYRFEVTGALKVRPPVETKKDPVPAPAPARFSLSGNLVIGPGPESGLLLCQFRNISAKGNSSPADGARKALEGRTARLSISDRGEILSVVGDDQVAVFLSHFEFVLPEGEESEWRQEGSDPAGSFVAIYRQEGRNGDESSLVMKLAKEKEYSADPSASGGVALLPRYSSFGSFDVKNGRMTRVEVSGTIPESDKSAAFSLSGQVIMTFLFEREEDAPIVEVRREEKTAKAPPVSRPGPTRPRITFGDISPNLYSPDSNLRSRALLQLTHVKGSQARRVLMEAVEDGDFRIRAAAAQSLATYRSEEGAMTRLLQLLKSDSNPLVRYRVAGALKGSASPEARELLATVASGDSSKFVRNAANAALAYPLEGGIDAH